MAQKWSESTAVRSAIVAGIFAIIVAVINGLFQPKKEPVPASSKTQDCEIKVDGIKIAYRINGKAGTALENDVIIASEGDVLELVNYELQLSRAGECPTTTIAAEAYLRKPERQNPDPDDKWDYDDGRFSDASIAMVAFKGTAFYNEAGEIGWRLGADWNKLQIVLVEYSESVPEGRAFRRFFFGLSNQLSQN